MTAMTMHDSDAGAAMRAAMATLNARNAMDTEIHAAHWHSGRDCTRTVRGDVLCMMHDPRAGRHLAAMLTAMSITPVRRRTR